MAAKQLKTFSDLYTAVMEMLKIQSGDTTAKDRVKRAINISYQHEVVPFHPWVWLRGNMDVSLEPVYKTGTATVTNASATVTLSTAPGTSKTGFYFTADGYNEIYKIRSHTADSVTVTLEAPFTGTSSSTATFKIWTDKIALPADCREVVTARQYFNAVPLEGMGLQKLLEHKTAAPKYEGNPRYFTLGDFVDPAPYAAIDSLPASVTRASAGHVKTIVFASSVASLLAAGDRIQVSGASHYSYNEEAIVSSVSTTTLTYTGTRNYNEAATADTGITLKLLSNEAADERYREMVVWPAISVDRRTINVDYIKEPPAMEDDSDEPLMPVSDRIVLFYGALSIAAPSLRGDREEGNNYRVLFQDKLARMAGKLDESKDTPRFQPDRGYMASLRSRRGVGPSLAAGMSGGSGSTSTATTGTPSRVSVFDANGELSSSAVTSTELAYLSGVGSTVGGNSDTATLTNKTINADNNTISNLAHGAEVDNPSTGVHGVTGSVVGTSDTQTLTNKKLSDSTCTIVDNSDNTKQLAFECSGITTATTRTVTVPDANLTMVGTATTQTLTNKTISASENTIQHLDSVRDVWNAAIAVSVASNALTIALKGADGSDPSSTNKVVVGFRNPTASTGTPVKVAFSAAESLVISSGSTLGHVSAVNEYVYVYGYYDGTNKGLFASSTLFDEGLILAALTAEGGAGAADSRNIGYSTATRTNVAVRLLCRLLSNQTTAGTWASSPSVVSMVPIRRPGTDEIWLHGGSGHGSTATAVRRFTTIQREWGASMTLTQDSTNGDKVVINETGVYHITYVDSSASSLQFGVGLNTSGSGTTTPSGLADANRLTYGLTSPHDSGNQSHERTFCGILRQGDEIRCHTGGVNGTSALVVYFRITRIS